MNPARTSRRRGYTLLEIAVVLVVLAILAVVGVVSYKDVRSNAERGVQDTAAQTYAATYDLALRRAATDYTAAAAAALASANGSDGVTAVQQAALSTTGLVVVRISVAGVSDRCLLAGTIPFGGVVNPVDGTATVVGDFGGCVG